MGREIRMVPPNWKFPTDEPMFDQTYEDACLEWKEGFAKWEAGDRPDHTRDDPNYQYWDYAGVPEEPEKYRPWKDGEGTWFQVWETVSEGTPVTPPFATKAELVDYLVKNGDEWDQSRGNGGWQRENAEAFVESGWAPSMMMVRSSEGNQIFEPRDGTPS